MQITLDQQVVPQRCPQCATDFTVIRGSIYDSGSPCGLYLIALHGHSSEGVLGHLALAILEMAPDGQTPVAAALDVVATPEQIGFRMVDWESSPWQDESYLGRMLSAGEAREGAHRDTFMHIAEHIVHGVPEVRSYLAESTG